MARRYFSSTAVATTTTGSLSNSATSITVAALTGYPGSTPWTAVLEPDTVNEEVVEVTNVSGTTLTVTRGVDGTSAVAHDSGVKFQHGVSARDFDEANAFVNGGGIPSTALTSTVPANLGSTAAAGSSTDVARRDHVHAFPSASDVGAVANSLFANKGTIAAASGANTPAALSVGSNGQMLMADSSATAGLRYVDPPANRNLIINGAMQVAQRGTSAASLTGTIAYNTADRWALGLVSLGTWTQSVENDAPAGSGIRKSLKMLCTTANASPGATAIHYINQSLEGQDVQRIAKGTASAQQLTASFWVKSNVTGTYIVTLEDNDNSRTVSASYTISASATWEQKTVTFPADATGAFDNDNASSLKLGFGLGAGSNYTGGSLQTAWGSGYSSFLTGQTNLAASTNNYWQVTGVQLETGIATPFEFEPYEATLRKCQRYYQKSYKPSSNAGAVDTDGAVAWNAASTTADRNYVSPVFPTPMRATPTVTLYSPVTGTSGKLYNALTSAADKNASTAYISQDRFSIYLGPTQGANATGDLLIAHYVASAEL